MVNHTLSFSHLDPNIVVERDGRIYRKIVSTKQGRWAGLDEFVRSEPFRAMMDFGWMPKHQIDHPIRDAWHEADYYEVERIAHFSPSAWWTKAQYAEAFMLVAQINAYLEPMGWLVSDCHPGNLTYLHSRPLYVDVGSLSRCSQEMARVHFNHALQFLNLEAPASWTAAQELLRCYQPDYPATEWDGYDKTIVPTAADQIKPADAEQRLLLDWTSGLGADLLDVGANKGKLSRLFAAHGFNVVAVDISPSCIDALWRSAQALKLRITSLCLNLAQACPHPAALACDIVVASSVTHHLFRQGADWFQQERLFRAVTRKWLLLERIEPADPHIQSWGLGQGYGNEAFREAFREWEIAGESTPELPTRRWYKLKAPG